MAEMTELQTVRRRAIHAVMDLSYMIFAFVLAFFWFKDGHNRDAYILLAVTYWGYPWPEHRYVAPRWRSAHIDGSSPAISADPPKRSRGISGEQFDGKVFRTDIAKEAAEMETQGLAYDRTGQKVPKHSDGQVSSGGSDG